MTSDKMLTEEAYHWFLEQLKFKFDGEYDIPNSKDFLKATHIFVTAIECGYSKKEFRLAVNDFVLTHKYKEWNIAHVLKDENRVKLHTQEWALKNKYDLKSMKWYAIDGKYFCTPSEVDDLPFERHISKQEPTGKEIETNGSVIQQIINTWKAEHPLNKEQLNDYQKERKY
jgi:hypothetical protein